MPAADGGTGVWIDAQLIILLLGVDGAYQADEGIIGTWERLR